MNHVISWYVCMKKKCYKLDFFSAFQCSTGGAVRGQIESSIFCYWSFYDFIDLIILCQISRVCVKYLETSLSARNACLLLSQSRLFEEPELMQRCWDVIDAQVQDFFVLGGWYKYTFTYILHNHCFYKFLNLWTSVSDPYHFDVDPDPDPDPRIRIRDPDPR